MPFKGKDTYTHLKDTKKQQISQEWWTMHARRIIQNKNNRKYIHNIAHQSQLIT